MSADLLKKSAIARLQDWYSSQCNEEWEHSYGIKIDTLDNPGWIVSVDLVETELEGISEKLWSLKRSEIDWVQYEAVDGKFIACGGPFNLEELIEMFLSFVDAHQIRP